MDCFGWDIPVGWVLVVLTSVLVYLYSTWPYDRFKKLGIPGPRPWPLVGNNISVIRKGLHHFQKEIHQQYGKIVGYYEGREALLSVKDQMLKEIMVKEFNHFKNRRRINDDPPMDHSLLFLADEPWHRVRRIMTSAFSTGKLKRMITTINECAHTLVSHFSGEMKRNGYIDARALANAFSMDVISGVGFGIKVDSQKNPDDPFVKHARNVFQIRLHSFLLRSTLPTIWKFLQRFLFVTNIPRSTLKFFRDITAQLVDGRRHNDKQNVDFLSLMLQEVSLKPDSEETSRGAKKDAANYEAKVKANKALTPDEITGNSMVFFTAGSETTATTLAILWYNLALNPDVQQQAIEEIKTVIGDKEEITQEMVNQLPYLDRCIQEALRINGPVIRTGRVCSEESEISGLKIPRGTHVIIPIAELHSDPKYWPEPHKFDPDRFLPEAKAARDPLTWIPFGFGPRNCIGMRLALLEAKIAAAKVLQKFYFRPCAKTEVPLKIKKTSDGLLRTENPIILQAESHK